MKVLFSILVILRVTSSFLRSKTIHYIRTPINALRRDKQGNIFVGEPEPMEELGEILERLKKKIGDTLNGQQPELIPIPLPIPTDE
jgi:hypothetical protein